MRRRCDRRIPPYRAKYYHYTLYMVRHHHSAAQQTHQITGERNDGGSGGDGVGGEVG